MDYEITRGEPVSTAVVRAVSAVRGDEPSSLRPLADVVDPEALDALFAPRGPTSPRTGGQVSFVYGRCRVTVESGEYLTVHPLAGRPLSRPDDDRVEDDDC